tara:strand:- start:256 stop:582 length:327 start_codon:yes stop_codon:yes gene_type:complete
MSKKSLLNPNAIEFVPKIFKKENDENKITTKPRIVQTKDGRLLQIKEGIANMGKFMKSKTGFIPPSGGAKKKRRTKKTLRSKTSKRRNKGKKKSVKKGKKSARKTRKK